jgi:hypothetical protein
VHKEYVKTKKVMDIVKDRYPRCQKDFKIMVGVAIKHVCGPDLEHSKEMMAYIGSEDYFKQLDRFDNLDEIKKLPLNHFKASVLLEYATGVDNLEDFGDPYAGTFYKLSQLLR